MWTKLQNGAWLTDDGHITLDQPPAQDPAYREGWKALANGVWMNESTGKMTMIDPQYLSGGDGAIQAITSPSGRQYQIDPATGKAYGTWTVENNNAGAPSAEDLAWLQGQKITPATAQENSNRMNQDAPGNGAGKGSMKEGILTSLSALAAMYGAGQFLGAGGGVPLDISGGLDGAIIPEAASTAGSTSSISGMGLTDPWAAGGTGLEMAGSVPNWTGATLDAVAPAASGIGASGAALPAAWQSALGVEGASNLAALNPGMLDKVRAAVTNPSTAATAGSALSRILKGEGAIEDYLSLGLKALPGVLGAIGSSSQASSLKDLADKYAGYGAPSRDRFEASFQPGFSMASDPGYQDALDQSSKATLHSLSVNGNPAGSPNAWAQSLQDNYQKTAYPALQQYRSTNAAAGGLGTAAAAAPGLATSAIGANGQTMANLGGAFRDVTSDTSTLADLMKKLKGASDIFSLAT